MGSEKQTVSKNGGRHLKLNIGLIVFIGIFIYLIAIGLSYLMRNHISFYEVQQGWIVDSDTFTGFILRNEAVVNTGQSGYINYLSMMAPWLPERAMSAWSLPMPAAVYREQQMDQH